MLFTLVALDKPDSLALRLATREAHLGFAHTTAKIKLGGPFLDAEGNMAGSLMIFEAEDQASAQAWHESDPYFKAGLFATSTIRPWKMTINECGASF